MIKKVHYGHNFIYLFISYESTDMNITYYTVTLFKYEIITDIQCLLKTALYLFFNEIPAIVFFTNLSISASMLFKNWVLQKIFYELHNSVWHAAG
jgi:hypothetical protein